MKPLRSFSELGDAIGQHLTKPGLIEGNLDEVAATKRRFDSSQDGRPFTATAPMRAFVARHDVLQKLAAFIDRPGVRKGVPRALSRLVRLVDSETLALVVGRQHLSDRMS